MYQIEQCPKCKHITEGYPVFETKRQVARTGGKWAIKKVLIYLLTPLICTILGPLGTISGFIVACIIVYYISKTAENITDSVDINMSSSTPFEFKCSHCGNYWKRTYEKGIDFTTDTVLKWQKDRLVEDLRSDASSSRITAIIAGIIAVPCTLYCLTHLSGQSDYLLWWLIFIIGFPALCLSINRGIKSHNLNEEAENLEDMSVSSFRHSDYRSGNPFVGVDKPLDKMDEVSHELHRGITQKEIVLPITQEPVKRLSAESTDSFKDNLAKLDELLAAGILTEEEYAEQKKQLAPPTVQYAIQTPSQRTQVDAKVENNKIAILHNLKLLFDSGVLTDEEYRKQKLSTLSVASIHWGKNMTPIEILIEMNYLLDAGILTKDEFDFHKKIVLSNEHTKTWSKSIKDTVSNLDQLINSSVLTEEELVELRNKLAKAAIPLAKEKDNKVFILNNLKLLIDAGIITPEDYRKNKQQTLSNKWIPWDNSKSSYEVLLEMKSLLDKGILTQEEFDFHKKTCLEALMQNREETEIDEYDFLLEDENAEDDRIKVLRQYYDAGALTYDELIEETTKVKKEILQNSNGLPK